MSDIDRDMFDYLKRRLTEKVNSAISQAHSHGQRSAVVDTGLYMEVPRDKEVFRSVLRDLFAKEYEVDGEEYIPDGLGYLDRNHSPDAPVRVLRVTIRW